MGAAAGREVQVIRCTTICNIWAFAGYAAAGCGVGRRAGSLETCGFKQTFWSLLGLWPKVTRARGRGTFPAGGMQGKSRQVAAAKSDPRSEARCPPFEKKNERAVEDDADPCKKHIALQKKGSRALTRVLIRQ